jgi:hypothetical protein
MTNLLVCNSYFPEYVLVEKTNNPDNEPADSIKVEGFLTG